jgi:hypothetical protein
MKRIFVILAAFCFIFMIGCKNSTSSPDKEMKCLRSVVINEVVFYVYEVEGHEYLGYIKTNGYFSKKPSFNCFLTHSETCKNQIHFPKRGTILIHKDGTTYMLPDTLIEKKNFEVGKGVVEIK